MDFLQILILAAIQGLAELLPVSSSAHVIVAEKLMGLDPSSPAMTFFLVMLHTGTMFAVMVYFASRWKKLNLEFYKMAIFATAITGFFGLALKFFIEKIILEKLLGHPKAEIEHLFKSLPLIACCLFTVGIIIFLAGLIQKKSTQTKITQKSAFWIGLVQGLCLPFRGFSRSGATISTGLFLGVPRALAEDFSFILAVLVTPPVIVMQWMRLLKNSTQEVQLLSMLQPGLIGMAMSFCTGLMALKFLSKVLEQGKWRFFGIYCWIASAGVMYVYYLGY